MALAMFRNKGRGDNSTKVISIEIFKEFFAKVFELDLEIVRNSEFETVVSSVEDLDMDFSLIELNAAIKKISSNKAPGNDGIPNEVWKSLPEITKVELLKIYNVMFNTGEIPHNWSEIIISPLYKKADPSIPSNYRPLSLANTSLKLFTQLLANRLLNWSSKNKVISDYKKNSGCRDHIFLLTSTIQYNFFIKRKVYALFVDLSQAFDTVEHKRLWTKLSKLGLSSKTIRILKSIYIKASARIRTNYGMSDSFPIEKGVLQGETVSPILWNLYLEDLIHELNKSDTLPVKLVGATLHALLYADDIILLAYTPGELQKKIDVLSAYLTDNGLKVNLSKTKYMVFSKRKDNVKFSIRWDDKPINRVESYVYLGVPFTEQLNFEFTKNHFVKKSELALRELESLIYRSKMNDFDSILSLFYSLVRSVFSYCSPIWGVTFSDCYEKLRIQFLKNLFLLPITIPAFFFRL